MKFRFFKHTAFSLVTFVTGLICVYLWFLIGLYQTEISVEIEDKLVLTVCFPDKTKELRLVAHGEGINIYDGRGGGTVFETENGEKIDFIDSCHFSKKRALRELRMRYKEAKYLISPTRTKFESILKNGGEVIFDTRTRIEIVTYDGKSCIEGVGAPTLQLAETFKRSGDQ